MYTFIQDFQTVGNTTSTLFAMPQQGTVNATVVLSCDGQNPLFFDFQQSPDGVTWTDMQGIGNPLNSSLTVGAQVSLVIASAYTQVRCIGYASGGSTLSFSITRYFNRPSGGNCPLIGGI